MKELIVNAKVRLYSILLKTDNSELTTTEIDLMATLAGDEDIQEILDHGD